MKMYIIDEETRHACQVIVFELFKQASVNAARDPNEEDRKADHEIAQKFLELYSKLVCAEGGDVVELNGRTVKPGALGRKNFS